MSVNLIEERRKRRALIQRYSLPPVTDDEEMRFNEKAVFWMAVLAVTPLILFHMINYFSPDFLWIPIAPY